MVSKVSKSTGTKAFSLSQNVTSNQSHHPSSPSNRRQKARRDVSPIQSEGHTQTRIRKPFDLNSAGTFEPREIKLSSGPSGASGVRHASTKRIKIHNETNGNNNVSNDEFVFTQNKPSSSQPIMSGPNSLSRSVQARRAHSTSTSNYTSKPASGSTTMAESRKTKRTRVEPPPPPKLPSPVGTRTPHQLKYLSFDGDTPVAIHRKRLPNTSHTTTHSMTPKAQPSSLTAEAVANNVGDTSFQFTVPLPMQDTPMIRRNQELRKQNNRRSSLGKRGKRASSIGNGSVAVPHNDISPQDYYKHLDPHLSDPQKMKNILIWSSTKVLEEEAKELHRRRDQLLTKAGRGNSNGSAINNGKLTTEEDTARKIARVVKEELLKDTKDSKINLSWWSRPEITTDALSNPLIASMSTSTARPAIRKPNMQNLINQQRLEQYKAKLSALQDEGRQWEAMRERVQATNITPNGDKLLATAKLSDKQTEEYLNGTIQRQNEGLITSVKARLDKVEYQADTILDTTDRVKSMLESTNDFADRKLAELSSIVIKRDQSARSNSLTNSNTDTDVAPMASQPLSTVELMRLLSMTARR
ncbi:hypothetical protein NADFUDRAFT_51595 [Nadsonia fulvescens var. elongata DSM 6958]|uniref:Uncharacterized protein n=1 Tax=Nadsonia fulvescens var. elongata DSM 6958 TaxID=857566 RepID=A0A1E3PHU8_9ASCO|nr:hypothetical protein NADFUDRAFT_51595 [Nadsonia fulvescens var. elongata DSM 6958]